MKISMKIGPQSTDTAKFQGFGMKMKVGGSATSSSSAPGRPQGLQAVAAGSSRSSAAAKAKAAAGGLSSLFRESMEEDESNEKKQARGVPVWSKPTVEAMQAQRQVDALAATDPNLFLYDEVIDDEKRSMDIEVPSQQVRTAVLEQKKKVGLVLREGAENVRVGSKRDAKYIDKVMIATDRRKVEQQMVEDRLLKKEQDAREGREVFVTQAFKEELKRRKKFEEELEEQERRDERRDATKMEDGKGFADFHRALLNDGLASSRGGEKNVDRAAPRLDLPSDEPVKEEKQEEDDKEAKDVKTEVDEDKAQGHGVQDVKVAEVDPATKKAQQAAEEEHRAEKAMSAKERFLARKRAAAEAAA